VQAGVEPKRGGALNQRRADGELGGDQHTDAAAAESQLPPLTRASVIASAGLACSWSTARTIIASDGEAKQVSLEGDPVSPEVHYARNGEVAIAYQVAGDGPVDLVFVPFIGNLAHVWEQPRFRRLFGELARISRLILLDKRGTGLSDRPTQMPILETRMDDLRAVLDAVGSTRAVLFGSVEGAQMTALYAATYPERTIVLVLNNPAARMMAAPDYPWGRSELEWQRRLEQIRLSWGERFSASCALSSSPVSPTTSSSGTGG
jgi:alpha/beta hydrolase fold